MFKMEYTFRHIRKDNTFKHHKATLLGGPEWEEDFHPIQVAKGEKTAFQLLIGANEDTHCVLDGSSLVSWKGLRTHHVRLELVAPKGLEGCFAMYFLGYLPDDFGQLVNDAILTEPQMLLEAHFPQTVWVEGTVPASWPGGPVTLTINYYHAGPGYDTETLLGSDTVEIAVRNVVLPPLTESPFYLDLWQHPSCLARYYQVPLWSDEHFAIIGHYLTELASLGEKVITTILSDYPWGGQSCDLVPKNASNLFEYNMVALRRDPQGQLHCDFTAFDRYVETAFASGITQEIDLFGLVGNWDRNQMGSPMPEYGEPLRLRCLDEATNTYFFLSDLADCRSYLEQLFAHLQEKGWWEKSFVMADEPTNLDTYHGCMALIDQCAHGQKVQYKSAVNMPEFMEECKEAGHSISPALSFVMRYRDQMPQIKETIRAKGGTVTWYVCCFPERPNSFLHSPNLESRLMGWYTYLFGLDGFLRWDYCLWTEDPWKDPGYKFPIWKAGDMYFVYPGRTGKPVRSVRLEQLRFGIQDFTLMQMLERRSGRDWMLAQVEEVLGGYVDPDPETRRMDLSYSLDLTDYLKIRSSLLEQLED